ncbi:Uncharacterized protein Rs2_39656 [Raphanus sativus]|nr:Uncharacterized protein Rs2_39656 [Raphanus sativus]
MIHMNNKLICKFYNCLDASVSSTVINGEWNISSRSRHSILCASRAALPTQVPDSTALLFLLRYLIRLPWMMTFSYGETPWPSILQSSQSPDFIPHFTRAHLRCSGIRLFGSKKRIPRHAFITWLVMRDRMVTRDRLLSWGMDVSPTCLLCSVSNDSAAHLFFECEYSFSVWKGLLSRSGIRHPQTLQDIILPWLSSSQITGKIRTILHLIFQASIYHLLKERNARIYANTSRSSNMIMKDVLMQLRTKLYSLDRKDTATQRSLATTAYQNPTYLYIWFDRIQG